MDEFYFKVSYNKGNDKHHAEGLSTLLIGSPAVTDDAEEVPSFLLEATKDNIHLETIELDSTVDFIENEFERDDQTIEIKERKNARLENITMEALLGSQRNDAFWTEINHRLNRGEKLSFSHNETRLLVRKIHADHQIFVPHSQKKSVIHLNRYRDLAGHSGDRKLYQRIRRPFYCIALAVDCYGTVRN